MAQRSSDNAKKKDVALKIADEQYDFKWQMYFNAFELEWNPNGCMVRLAYVNKGTASEVVPVFVPREGVQHLQQSSERYIQQLSSSADFGGDSTLPGGVRTFSPLFANYIRLARSGETCEIGMFTVALHSIAAAARGQITASAEIHAVPVALLHSDTKTHINLVISLISGLQ